MRTGGTFYFPWHRHQIEGTNGFYCLIRKTLASGVTELPQFRREKFLPKWDSNHPDKSWTHNDAYSAHAFTEYTEWCYHLPDTCFENSTPRSRRKLKNSIFNIYICFDVIFLNHYTCHSSLYISDNKERNKSR